MPSPVDVEPPAQSAPQARQRHAQVDGRSRALTAWTWHDVRAGMHSRTVAVLRASRHERLVRLADRMDGCRKSWHARFYPGSPGASRAVPFCCESRLCAPCTHSRAAVHRATLEAIHEDARRLGRTVKFLTLTQRAIAGESLRAAQARLRASLRKLFRRRAWCAWMAGGGGLGRIEVTWNDEGGWWHVHAHLVADPLFIPVHELRALWEAVTDGAFGADIREARPDVAEELLKYLVKAAELPDARLVEYARTMLGRREVFTFGAAYGSRTPLALRVKALQAADALADAEHGESVLVPFSDLEALAVSDSPAAPAAREALEAIDAQILNLRTASLAREVRRGSRTRGRPADGSA